MPIISSLICINCKFIQLMASLQVDRASPLEDVITETEATSKESPPVASPPAPATAPPENDKIVDLEDEDDLEDLTAPPYEEKVGNSDDEEEKDAEYSPYMGEGEPPLSYGGGPAAFDDLNEEDDPEDEDDV